MDTEAAPARQRFTLLVRNTRGTAETLFLELGGADYVLPPGEACEIRAEGPARDQLEIDFGPEQITVWAWPGSIVEVWQNGLNLSGPSIPVPAVPEGMSVRGFLGMVLGDPKLRKPD